MSKPSPDLCAQESLHSALNFAGGKGQIDEASDVLALVPVTCSLVNAFGTDARQCNARLLSLASGAFTLSKFGIQYLANVILAACKLPLAKACP